MFHAYYIFKICEYKYVSTPPSPTPTQLSPTLKQYHSGAFLFLIVHC
jgi:hypothetical protein